MGAGLGEWILSEYVPELIMKGVLYLNICLRFDKFYENRRYANRGPPVISHKNVDKDIIKLIKLQ